MWDDDSIHYDCAGWRWDFTDEQIDELGLNKKSGRHKNKSNLITVKECDREWYDHSFKFCGDNEYSAYHGTSKESAKKILRDGFEMFTGILGNGVYFAGRDTPFTPNFEYSVKYNSAVRYAKDNNFGSVIATCIPKNLVKTSRTFYKKVKKPDSRYEFEFDWVTPKWIKEFNELKRESPESLELYFSWHGHKFDTIQEVRDAWNEEGEKVRKFAVDHGIKVWSDNIGIGQYVVYDPEVLKNLKLRELTSCRTSPVLE